MRIEGLKCSNFPALSQTDSRFSLICRHGGGLVVLTASALVMRLSGAIRNNIISNAHAFTYSLWVYHGSSCRSKPQVLRNFRASTASLPILAHFLPPLKASLRIIPVIGLCEHLSYRSTAFLGSKVLCNRL